MKFDNVLKELTEKNKTIEEALRRLPSRRIKSDKAIIENLTKLAYFFFSNNQESEAMVICNELAKIDFNNDYDYWTWIEYSLCLRAELSLKTNDNEKRKESIALIKDALMSGDGLAKKIKIQVHERFMNGEGINLDEIQNDNKTIPVAEEFETRMIYLMKLLKVKAFGGSKVLGLSKVDTQIQNNLSLIKNIINKVGQSHIPFFN